MMNENFENIKELQEKLNLLMKKQEDFYKEIRQLQIEIFRLKEKQSSSLPGRQPADRQIISEEPEAQSIPVTKTVTLHHEPLKKPAGIQKPSVASKNFEKFIGENLSNKIGIAITVIGISIGAKYAIDHQLISPLTRIILGYLAGLILLALAIRLKKKYENFSAVLLSGSMAILYFITYAAYSFYSLLPQTVTFLLMVLFTIFTVLAAINYNRQVIALIGLTGAYAIPFLLSDGSGKVAVLFSYMAIINCGILYISFKKYWKAVFYSAFILTWLIYASWYFFDYSEKEHFSLALIFLTAFFIIFYISFLAYKLIKKEKFIITDISFLLINSFIFYGIGYDILNYHTTGSQLLGVFTLMNAIIHFIVSVTIYKNKLADKNLFYLVTGMVLVFITIAIPVQLNGSWVTLLWVAEAALLFWIGKSKNVSLYEKLSWPLMILAFFSLLHDWSAYYNHYLPSKPETAIQTVLNSQFLCSLLFVALFGFMWKVNVSSNSKNSNASLFKYAAISNYLIPVIFITALYLSIRVEIATYWNQLYEGSFSSLSAGNRDFVWFKTIWNINYTLLFLCTAAFIIMFKIKKAFPAYINIALLLLALLTFHVQGLYAISMVRESFLEPSQYFESGYYNIYIRHISLVFVALSLFVLHRYVREAYLPIGLKKIIEIVLHVSVIWLASSELIHWMDLAGYTQLYKLGLSILWGVYALFMIILGIWKKRKALRMMAIILFGITLIKLFFYDISHLNTLSKTIVMVSLGVLLLIISFLYNKYKHIISDEN